MNGYRLLLRLAPRRLRLRHGRAMEALFRQHLRTARLRGPHLVACVWMAALADLLGSRLRHALARLHPRDRVGPITPRSPIMIGSDVRYAIRSLTRQKLGSGLVVVMLAVGIAANVAVFSLVNGLFLRPFPYPEPDRLVYLNERAPKWNLDATSINFPDFYQWRQSQRAFEAMAVWARASYNVGAGDAVERMLGLNVTHDIADVLGVRPAIGRMFTAEEDRPGGADLVVLGYGLWRDRFGGSADVLGRTLRLSGRDYEIIGVLPEHADTYPGETRFWVPLRGDPAAEANYRYEGIGRVRPGVTVQQAEADLTRAHQPIWETRERERIVSPFVTDLRDLTVKDYRPIASTLALAVGLLLLIACANVASLMLARALARRREMSIRLAVGASRLRVLRQLFIENIVLALAGGALGLLFGHLAIEMLVTALPNEAPAWARFALDGRVVMFAGGISAFTVLLFGWAPALHALTGDLRAAMHNAVGGPTASPGGRRTLWALVTAEFALAALLLVCGGLLWRAYDRVRQSDPGFDANGVLTVTVSLPSAVYRDDETRMAFWDRVLERVDALPGVTNAALVSCPPLSLGCHWGTLWAAEGQPLRAADEMNPIVLLRLASGDYFQTMGIKLKSGRFLEPRDGRSGRQNGVVIVNEEFARTFFPGVADPIGRRVRPGTSDDNPWFTVVGVIEDARHYGLEQSMRPGVYIPLALNPGPTLTAVVKAAGDPAALTGSVRAMIRDLDPELPLFNVRTMEEALQRSLSVRTVYSWMLAVFACMAVVLALGGTYGVTSYLVSQRLREIGIRVALGARGADIVSTVLKSSLAVAGAGTLFGILASMRVAGLLSDLLFGVSTTDVVIVSGAAAVLIAAALLANIIPARRAAGVDPMVCLRTD